MITLNLLPYSKRREIETEKGNQLVLVFGIFSLFFLFVTVVLMLANVVMRGLITDLMFRAVSYDQNRAEALNRKTAALNKIQENFILYTDSLIDFTKIVPSGVKIEDLMMDKTNKDIKIRGAAKSRDDLMQFKENLEESGRFLNVRLPTENMLAEGYISFEIAAGVNFSKL